MEKIMEQIEENIIQEELKLETLEANKDLNIDIQDMQLKKLNKTSTITELDLPNVL
jgi:hypothetical protein